MKPRDDYWWTIQHWGGRRPLISTDEYYQHTLVLAWPFRPRHYSNYGPTYRALVIRLPSTCRRALREELDYLRDDQETK